MTCKAYINNNNNNNKQNAVWAVLCMHHKAFYMFPMANTYFSQWKEYRCIKLMWHTVMNAVRFSFMKDHLFHSTIQFSCMKFMLEGKKGWVLVYGTEVRRRGSVTIVTTSFPPHHTSSLSPWGHRDPSWLSCCPVPVCVFCVGVK